MTTLSIVLINVLKLHDCNSRLVYLHVYVDSKIVRQRKVGIGIDVTWVCVVAFDLQFLWVG